MMKSLIHLLYKQVIVFFLLMLLFSESKGVNFIVDNATDNDNFLAYTAGDGTNTFRKCIRLANNTPNGGTPHSIAFAGAITTITLTSSLPSLNNNANAGGLTISGGAGPSVTIVGAGAYSEIINPNTVNGVVVRNLRLTNCAPCIHIVSASNCIVQGCHLGTDATSTGIQALSTTSTRIIHIEGATSTNNLIGGNLTLASERNVIVGAGQDGSAIYILQGSGNIVRGNYIGTTTTGNAVWSKNWGAGVVSGGNNARGINLENSNNNIIGGTGINDRNIISGNRQDGIRILNSDDTQIINNFLGVGQNGTTAIVNGNMGGGTIYSNISLEGGSDNTQIISNVISNCPNHGIAALSGTNNSITIRGNYIGLDANGTSAGASVMGNLRNGIHILNGTGHIIGGPGGAADRNIICNNGTPSSANNTCSYYGDTGPGGFWGAGIYMNGVSTVTIAGNYIGVDISGNTARGNLADGIFVEGTSTGISIGGTTSAYRNIICSNGFGNPSNQYVWPCRRNGIKFYAGGGAIIRNNYLGLAADGVTVLGNGLAGVGLQNCPNNSILDNVFCANDFGVCLEENSNNNLIYNNIIGLKADGITAAGNGVPPLNPTEGAGILVQGCTGNRIGNSGAGQGNTIAYNRVNILFRKDWTAAGATANYIQNNIIRNAAYAAGNRTDKSATLNNIYNISVMGAGIAMLEGSNNNFIGGTNPNEQNQIYDNEHNGIFIDGSNKNEIRRNSSYCNGSTYADNSNDEKGINLDLGSGTPGNNSYPAPVVGSVGSAPPLNSDANTLRGTAPANSLVEIFSIEPCLTCPAGGGIQTEGQTYRTTVTADGAGNWSWTPGTPLNGQYTATASEPTAPRNTSEFATCGFITLPVEWLSFTGKATGESVQLNWVTASEKNNRYFIVQRSTDGKNFETIGQEPGGNNSNTALSYVYAGPFPAGEIIYYRIMQVDYDGKTSFTNVLSISNQQEEDIMIFPNPTEGEFWVSFSSATATSAHIYIINSIGEKISEEFYDLGKTASIHISQFPAGVYFVIVQTDTSFWTKKIIKTSGN
ncbi:MAG: T9SS type A sorting domain-containing protein [Cytophagaceae bacterium]|nr:T9SS type A sorting domain-containing protein [Cytophagaceae bacterium]